MLRAEGKIEVAQKIIPGANVLAVHDDLGAVWIVKIEQIGLRPDCRRPETRGMIRIAFNFDRTALATRYDDSLRVSVEGRRGREVQWFTRHDFWHLSHVGNDFLERLPCARAESSERQRRAAEADEFAAT